MRGLITSRILFQRKMMLNFSMCGNMKDLMELFMDTTHTPTLIQMADYVSEDHTLKLCCYFLKFF